MVTHNNIYASLLVCRRPPDTLPYEYTEAPCETSSADWVQPAQYFIPHVSLRRN
jgi:hypothetical protein